jgi:hypothetical protein
MMTEYKPRLRILKIAAGLLLVAAVVAALPGIARHRLEAARRHWKNDAIPVIASGAEDRTWRAQEIGILTNRTADPRVLEEGWLTDKLILMQNGEWLVYKSHCSKAAPRFVKDIFLAKGSDGKWYYSTFHFCVGMITLRGEDDPPPNLALFVHEYNLREFDGRSDKCLQETDSLPASWRQKNKTNTANIP